MEGLSELELGSYGGYASALGLPLMDGGLHPSPRDVGGEGDDRDHSRSGVEAGRERSGVLGGRVDGGQIVAGELVDGIYTLNPVFAMASQMLV